MSRPTEDITPSIISLLISNAQFFVLYDSTVRSWTSHNFAESLSDIKAAEEASWIYKPKK